MQAESLTIGLDWGTHSSKSWYVLGNRTAFPGPKIPPRVLDSTLYRLKDGLSVFREGTPVPADVFGDARLKRRLLVDPMGADFWDATRQGIGVSLGEAATLVLCGLVSDVTRNLANEGIQIKDSTQVKLRFSLPNWTEQSSEHKAARERMFQTAVVISSLLGQFGWKSLPPVGQTIDIQRWRGMIKEVRLNEDVHSSLKNAPGTFAELVGQEYGVGRLSWRFAAESSAAGFLPLTHLLRDVPSDSGAQKHWVKLLVVDVGAGSTDTGYFVSSRSIQSDHDLVFNYLPPALTLDYAGETLTEKLLEYLKRTRGRNISNAEAEAIKIGVSDQWTGEEFASDWRNRIAKSVGEYIGWVPDDRRLLDERLPLKIVLTGGSGVVKGLGEVIRGTVVGALVSRGMQTAGANRTELVALKSPIKDIVDAARRAVSTGAAQPDFARLVYVEKLEKIEKMAYSTKPWT